MQEVTSFESSDCPSPYSPLDALTQQEHEIINTFINVTLPNLPGQDNQSFSSLNIPL